MTGAARDDGSVSPPDLGARMAIEPAEPRLPWGAEAHDREVFLFIYLGNLSQVGIFLPTRSPVPVGIGLELLLETRGGETLRLQGRVQWVNPWRPGGDNLNPGMGVLLTSIDADLREQLVEEISTIAYLR